MFFFFRYPFSYSTLGENLGNWQFTDFRGDVSPVNIERLPILKSIYITSYSATETVDTAHTLVSEITILL